MNRKEQALACLARGWSVIPLWPKSKTAMVKWTEYQRRLPTEDEVSTWWETEPDANIGIITGQVSGFIVGDVDPRHGGSVQQMQTDAPSPFVVTTPGGGAHFYYRHPGGRVQKGKPRPGIDLQSDGCYVVGPGSYVVTQAYEGEYHQLSQGELPDAPTWLLADQHEESHGTTPNEAWIARTLRDGCQPGTRNDTLARLAGYLAGHAVPLDVAGALLLPWSARQSGTGVTPEEAARTIESIYAKEARGRKAPVGKYVVDDFVQDDESQPLEALPLSEFVSRYYSEKPTWLIPDWLPERTIAFLVSPPGRFKTMLTFDIAISVAGGFPFLGQYAVQRPGPVLVIQQEDDYGDMARRFSRIFSARAPVFVPVLDESSDTLPGLPGGFGIPPVFVCTTRGFCLNPSGLRRLEDLVRTLRPRVVVIDPLYSITSAEDFMMTAARDMMPLKGLRDAYDVSFLIAAHTKKGADTSREGLWGSQFLNAFLETGWQIRDREEGENNQVQLVRHFKSAGQPSRLNLEFLLDDQEGYKVNVTDAEEDAPQDVILAELSRVPEGLAVKALAERAGLAVEATKKRLQRFKKKGLVTAWEHPGEPTTWKLPKDTTSNLEGKSD